VQESNEVISVPVLQEPIFPTFTNKRFKIWVPTKPSQVISIVQGKTFYPKIKILTRHPIGIYALETTGDIDIDSELMLLKKKKRTVCPYAQAQYTRANARIPSWGGSR